MLRWYGHVLRKEDNDWEKKYMEHEVEGVRSRGRPKRTWSAYAGVESLSARRYELGKRFSRTITNSESCLHDLLPQRRDSDIISRLRRQTTYPIPRTRTNKYRSFIHFALAKYQ